MPLSLTVTIAFATIFRGFLPGMIAHGPGLVSPSTIAMLLPRAGA
jgi:hypothetical protein